MFWCGFHGCDCIHEYYSPGLIKIMSFWRISNSAWYFLKLISKLSLYRSLYDCMIHVARFTSTCSALSFVSFSAIYRMSVVFITIFSKRSNMNTYINLCGHFSIDIKPQFFLGPSEEHYCHVCFQIKWFSDLM